MRLRDLQSSKQLVQRQSVLKLRKLRLKKRPHRLPLPFRLKIIYLLPCQLKIMHLLHCRLKIMQHCRLKIMFLLLPFPLRIVTMVQSLLLQTSEAQFGRVVLNHICKTLVASIDHEGVRARKHIPRCILVIELTSPKILPQTHNLTR